MNSDWRLAGLARIPLYIDRTISLLEYYKGTVLEFLPGGQSSTSRARARVEPAHDMGRAGLATGQSCGRRASAAWHCGSVAASVSTIGRQAPRAQPASL
jgi:hypothetical protein